MIPRGITLDTARRSLNAEACAALKRIDWFNLPPLEEPIEGTPPASAEQRFFPRLDQREKAAWSQPKWQPEGPEVDPTPAIIGPPFSLPVLLRPCRRQTMVDFIGRGN